MHPGRAAAGLIGGVMAPVGEATFVAGKLADLGGAPETYPVSDEAVEQAQTAAASAS